jgi:hypothetical protein
VFLHLSCRTTRERNFRVFCPPAFSQSNATVVAVVFAPVASPTPSSPIGCSETGESRSALRHLLLLLLFPPPLGGWLAGVPPLSPL